MSLKKNILKKYIWDTEILYLIWHSSLEYNRVITIYSILLFVLFWLYWIIKHYVLEVPSFVNRIFWIIWIIIYWRFIISFMDIYLDAIIITNNWIIMFKWEWFMTYNSETINWNWILSVYENQTWLIDLLLNEWDIKFKTPWSIYTFNNVHDPKYQKEKILKIQKDVLSWKKEQEEPELDKFDMLVETLWEVIIDYVKKSKK
jgi:hypothetical protein